MARKANQKLHTGLKHMIITFIKTPPEKKDPLKYLAQTLGKLAFNLVSQALLNNDTYQKLAEQKTETTPQINIKALTQTILNLDIPSCFEVLKTISTKKTNLLS
jgi:hypothetical protein